MATERLIVNGLPVDVQQLEMDLADCRAVLAHLRKAIEERDEAEATVRSLQASLRGARRRAKEAGWRVAALICSARRT